jgi:hypothetical protein
LRIHTIKSTQQYYQDPKLRESIEEVGRGYFPLQRIREDPLFQKKKPNHP